MSNFLDLDGFKSYHSKLSKTISSLGSGWGGSLITGHYSGTGEVKKEIILNDRKSMPNGLIISENSEFNIPTGYLIWIADSMNGIFFQVEGKSVVPYFCGVSIGFSGDAKTMITLNNEENGPIGFNRTGDLGSYTYYYIVF